MPSLDEIFKQMPNAALAYLKDQKLDEIECVIADLPGIARGKAVPATKFAPAKHVLFARFNLLSNHHGRLG